MGFNLKVTLHVAALVLTISLLAWCLLSTGYYATMLTLSLVLVIQVLALLRYVSGTNRELSRFLSAVKHADFSQSFQGNRSHRSFVELGHAFENLMEQFRMERGEKEAQASYMQAFVQQLPIAVFALNEEGRIVLANQAFRNFIRGPCHHLDQIRAFDPTLGNFLATLQPGREQSLRLRHGDQTLQLKLTCSLLRQRGQLHKLVSLQDIGSELESRELEAWQNLIRVMTHEIMNSITPITSLADTAHHYILEAREHTGTDDAANTNNALLEDAASAVTTIGKRGQGLMRFVESYRTLSRLPTPRPKTLRVQQLLQSVCDLMQEQAAQRQCRLNYTCKPVTLELVADGELLEQALINLVRNALDAVAGVDAPTVTLQADLRERGLIVLGVADNGCGIDQENLDNIFVPFFTTKRGGNGIGMTLVRQIVQLNGGVIRVHSRPGEGTLVDLQF